jgi:hypothetical protein
MAVGIRRAMRGSHLPADRGRGFPGRIGGYAKSVAVSRDRSLTLAARAVGGY